MKLDVGKQGLSIGVNWQCGDGGGISATICMKIEKLPIFVQNSWGMGMSKIVIPHQGNPDKYT